MKKFLFYGEMLRPPVLKGKFPVLAAKWGPDQEETRMPAVMHSAWKAEDGSMGMFFTNMSETAHTVSYSIDLNDYGIEKASGYKLKRNDEKKTSTYRSAVITRTDKIPGRSVIYIQIQGEK